MSLKTVAEKPNPTTESAAATMLSMQLKRIAPEAKLASSPKSPANSPDEIDDMWDNVPV